MAGWSEHIALGSLATVIWTVTLGTGAAEMPLYEDESAIAGKVEAMCVRKARLLESYLNSPSAKQIESEGAQEARDMLAGARMRLVDAAGDIEEDMACPMIDEGLRLITAAMTTSGLKSSDTDKHKSAYARRLRQLNAYLGAISVSSREQWPTQLKRRFSEAEVQIARAQRLADENRIDDAYNVMEMAYAAVLAILRDVHDGRSVINKLVFETPAEEYQYEVDRNRSYEMLVTIAMAESPASEELRAHVTKVLAYNETMRAKARRQTSANNYVGAIGTLELASREMAKTLRLLGVMAWD